MTCFGIHQNPLSQSLIILLLIDIYSSIHVEYSSWRYQFPIMFLGPSLHFVILLEVIRFIVSDMRAWCFSIFFFLTSENPHRFSMYHSQRRAGSAISQYFFSGE